MTNTTEKRAPVQGYPGGIPWAIHLEAYEVYCKRYGAQPALIDLEGRNCRGGFGTGELDQFIPGWRDRVAEFGLLKTKVAEQAAQLDDYATEINRLRNVIQAACLGGTDLMIERWKVLFPDAPVPSVKRPEPAAWVVYWGEPPIRKHSVHFERKTAEEAAAEVKSTNTRIDPVFGA